MRCREKARDGDGEGKEKSNREGCNKKGRMRKGKRDLIEGRERNTQRGGGGRRTEKLKKERNDVTHGVSLCVCFHLHCNAYIVNHPPDSASHSHTFKLTHSSLFIIHVPRCHTHTLKIPTKSPSTEVIQESITRYTCTPRKHIDAPFPLRNIHIYTPTHTCSPK